MHIADYAVLALYFLGITAIGFWSARQIRSSGEFFMPHKSGKFMMVMVMFCGPIPPWRL
jgi:Na+/proline symporter